MEGGKWTKKTKLLKHRGRDKGRSTAHRRAAEAEAEALRVRMNEETRQAEIEALEAPKGKRFQLTLQAISRNVLSALNRQP